MIPVSLLGETIGILAPAQERQLAHAVVQAFDLDVVMSEF